MIKKTKNKNLRPTTSAVKNAIFSMLGDIEGLRFLDLFSGSGNIALEASLRGANVLAIEKDRKRSFLIESKDIKVIQKDAINFLRSLEEKFDIIFADPPYNFENYEELIELSIKSLEENGIFILEHSKFKTFNPDKEKHYGDTYLSIWYTR